MRNAFFLGPEKTEGLQEPLLDVAQSVLSAPNGIGTPSTKMGKSRARTDALLF